MAFRLRPADGRYRTVWDTVRPGMAVRIGTRGKPSFYAVARIRGASQPTWRALGTYPDMTLADARDAAGDALRAMEAGHDPKQIEADRRRAAAEQADNTFAAVVEQFNAHYHNTPGKRGSMRRTADAVAATIARELTPKWGDRPIGEITERDVDRTIRAIMTRGGPAVGAAAARRRATGGRYAARAAFSAARLVFRWAHRAPRRLISTDPTAGIDAIDLHGAPATRDRVLDDHELPVVWRAAEATPYPYGPLVKLLLLTGARLREIAEARWSEIEIDAATLTVPTSRTKTRAAHVIPLTAPAMAIIAELPRFTDGDYLFSTTRGRRAISGFSKFRAKFDRALDTELAPFTIHDCRRTCRTNLAALGVLPVIAELVIGHQQQGVQAIYDRHTYTHEKRAALELWADRLASIVAPDSGPPGNVVPLRRA